ncbi:MAG TPA: glycosyltransferase family 39 protein, partial [Sumerlaeia bacterium]|nr:glycosyltransferase family 39 protein [Sumerlaeia bacterium]
MAPPDQDTNPDDSPSCPAPTPEAAPTPLLGDADGAPKRAAWIALALLCLLHLLFLTRKGLWNNEFITLGVLGLSWRDVIVERLRMNHMPGYFLMLKAWTLVFGTSEAALRLPSALFSLGTVAVTWDLARRAWGGRAAMRAACLAAAGQNLLSLSADARMYSSVLFWCVLSMHAYLLLLDRPSWRARAVYVLAGVGGVFVHLLFAMTFAVQALHWLTVRRRAALRARWLLPMMAAPFVVWLPWLATWTNLQYKIGRDAWDLPSPGKALREFLRVLWGDYDFDLLPGEASRALSVPMAVATVGLVVWAAWRATRALRRAVPEGKPPGSSGTGSASPSGALADSFVPWWLLGPALFIWLTAFKSDSVIGSQRYYTVAAAAAPIAVARTMDLIRAAAWRRLYMASAFGLVFWYGMAWLADPGSGLRQTTRYIQAHAGPDDAIILSHDGASRRAFAYYGLGHMRLGAINRGKPGGLANDAWPERLRAEAVRLAEGRHDLWLVLYRAKRIPLPEALSAEGSPFESIEVEERPYRRFGECALYHYRLRQPTSGH